MAIQESLRDHLNVIIDDVSHPLKRHEDDEFAVRLIRAEIKLDAHGLSEEMINLLIQKESLLMTPADAAWEGRASVDRTRQRIRALEEQMLHLAKKQEVEPEVRAALGIPMMT